MTNIIKQLQPLLWTNDPHLYRCYSRQGKNTRWGEIWSQGPDEFDRNLNWYWGIAEFSHKKRTQERAVYLKAFFVDLDGATKEQIQQFTGFVKEKFPNTPYNLAVVTNTNKEEQTMGVHLYWILDAPIPAKKWKDYAEKFLKVLQTSGVEAIDGGVTKDSARVLRIPGTYNINKGSETRLMGKVPTEDSLIPADKMKEAITEAYNNLPSAKLTVSEGTNNFTAGLDNTGWKADVKDIYNGCAQMKRWMDSKGKDIHYNEWLAMLSILRFCEGGEDLVHKYSEGDPRYDPSQVDQKVASMDRPPSTCEWIQTVDGMKKERCEGCKHDGKSPISANPNRKIVGNYRFGDGKVREWVVDDNGNSDWEVIYDCNLEVLDVCQPVDNDDRNPPPAYVYVLFSNSRMSQRVPIEYRLLSPHNTKDFSSKLHDLGWGGYIPHWIERGGARVRQYISQIALHNQEQGIKAVTKQMGWTKRGPGGYGLIVGNQKYCADSTQEVMLAGGVPELEFREPPTLEGWKQGLEYITSPGFDLHKFVIFAMAASPLYQLVSPHNAPAVLTLVGESGTGKTISSWIGLSVFGSRQLLSSGSSDTAITIRANIAKAKNLPVLVDEMTELIATENKYNDTVNRPSKLIEDIPNREDRGRTSTKGDPKPKADFNLQCVFTSNTSLRDLTTLTEAQQQRLMELYIGRDEDNRERIEKARDVCLSNLGTAGEPLVRYILNNQDNIVRMYQNNYAELSKDMESAARFRVTLLAGGFTMMQVMHDAGLLPDSWDQKLVDRVKRSTLRRHQQDKDRVTNVEELVTDAVREYIEKNCVEVAEGTIPHDGNGSWASRVLSYQQEKSIAARETVIGFTGPDANLRPNEIRMHRRWFTDYIKNNKVVPMGTVLSVLEKKGLINEDSKALKLGANSKAKCLVLRLDKMEQLIKEDENEDA